MTSTSYRGVVRGRTVLLEDDPCLPDGTEVVVTPTPGGSDDCAPAAALLAALKTAPPVPPEWVDELEALIAQGRRPPTHEDPLTSDSTPPGGP